MNEFSAKGKVRRKGPIIFHGSRQCLVVAIAIKPRWGLNHWRGAFNSQSQTSIRTGLMAFEDDHDYVTIYLDGYVSPEDHIRHVQEAANGLVRAHVECETETDYGGGERGVMYVSGYKVLTEAEKEAKRLKRREEEAERERREREQYERLKAKFFPEGEQ